MPASRTRRVSLRPVGPGSRTGASASARPSSSPRHAPRASTDAAEALALAATSVLQAQNARRARARASPAAAAARPPKPRVPKGSEALLGETRRVLAALDPLASEHHPRHRARRSSAGLGASNSASAAAPGAGARPPSGSKSVSGTLDTEAALGAPSLAAFRAQLLARSTPAPRRASLPGAAASGPTEEDAASAAQVDWPMYRDWPEGLLLEEEAVHTYFERLKFIFLEQATKLTFLNDCHEDPETGKEGVVHDHHSVRDLEEKAAQAKAELAEAKAQVRQVRADIDAAVAALAQPWAQLEADAAEARTLVAELADMELELAQIRATSGRARRRSSGAGAGAVGGNGRDDNHGDVDDDDDDDDDDEDDLLPGAADVDATVPPAVGTLTVAEAEAFCAAQLERMQDLVSETERLGEQAREADAALRSALRRAERKATERKQHEAQLEEMRAGARDLRIEELCTSRTALLALLRAALGVAAIDTPTPNEVHVTYDVPGQPARQVKLLVTYRPGGASIDHYCVVDPTDDQDTPLAPRHVALLDAASEANQTTALVQNLWAACLPPVEA